MMMTMMMTMMMMMMMMRIKGNWEGDGNSCFTTGVILVGEKENEIP